MKKDELQGYCGVYAIGRIGTDQCAIGYSAHIPRRWGEHGRQLRGNRHPNPFLQRAWNQYGEEAFEFVVLE